jgi:hypothetical protein
MFLSSNLEEVLLNLQFRSPTSFFCETFSIFPEDHQMLHSNSKLKKIHFTTEFEGEFEIWSLIEALARFCPNIEYLFLDVDSITDIELSGILKSFSLSLKQLICFRRNDEDIDWGNADYNFPFLFSQCTKLHEFGINYINENEVPSFVHAIVAAPSLRKFTSIHQKGQQLLKQFVEEHHIPNNLFRI